MLVHKNSYDSIVIGAGACGCWAAKILAEGGLSTLLVDAGPEVSRASQEATHASRRPRQHIQSRSGIYSPDTSHLFVDDTDNPYRTPEENEFIYIRGRQVGGRAHQWGRCVYRFSDFEFKNASRDGIGEDWPIEYADLAAAYDEVESYLLVRGSTEGLRQLPDGRFLTPGCLSDGERRLAAAIAKKSRPEERLITARQMLGEFTWLLNAAEATGRLTVRPDTVVSRLVTDDDSGRVGGILFMDRVSREEHLVKAPVVFLCASTIESTRLLLNSASARHPGGIGASSGVLGNYLMDHAYSFPVRVAGVVPDARRIRPESYGALKVASAMAYIPNFRNLDRLRSDFFRGWAAEVGVGRGSSPFGGSEMRAIIDEAEATKSSEFWIRTMGEVLPLRENRVTVDPDQKDAWGIPVARIELQHGDNEKAMAKDQLGWILETVQAAGFEVRLESLANAAPGECIHELGSTRMGTKPEGSVLNKFNQVWDAPNLFVTGGGAFVSGGTQNPTLTMMALTVRACEHAIRQLKRGEL